VEDDNKLVRLFLIFGSTGMSISFLIGLLGLQDTFLVVLPVALLCVTCFLGGMITERFG
jgi:hypothetical protein